MMKVYRKALAWLLCLTMLFTMSTGMAFANDIPAGADSVDKGAAADQQIGAEDSSAGESAGGEAAAADNSAEPDTETGIRLQGDKEADGGSINIVSGDTATTVTAEQIKSATCVEATADEPWTNAKGGDYVGKFYKLTSILDEAGISYEGFHGMKTVATDGFTNGFKAEEIEKVYIYDQGEVLKNGKPAGDPGTYGTAINGKDVAGNKWAKGVAKIEMAKDHVWFIKKGACMHYCAICSENEPGISVSSSDAEDKIIHDCEIKAVTAVVAEEGSEWTYGKNKVTGNFYKLSTILENAGVTDVESLHGIVTVSSDGFTTGFAQKVLDEVYIYDQSVNKKNGKVIGEPMTYGTAVNGAAGNKWAKSIAAVKLVKSHTPFIKGGNEASYCAVCGEEIFKVDGEYFTLQDLIDKAADGDTVKINRSVDYSNEAVLDAGTKTVTLDLDGNRLSVKEQDGTGLFTVKGGTIKLENGTVDAELKVEGTGKIVAESGKYSMEVPEAMCGAGKVPVYDSKDGLYEMKAVSAYDSQKAANELGKVIRKLEAQLAEMRAAIMVSDISVTVKAVPATYNKITLTWEADQPADGFKVQKKVEDVWTDIVPVAEGKYVDDTEPGIVNEYRVAAGVAYAGLEKEEIKYGKYVNASAKTGLAKAGISGLTTKSKKLTIKWKAVEGADSYDVWVGTNSAVSKGLVKYNNVKNLSQVTKKLKKNKKYYVKVRAHVKNSKGTVVYGAWSAAKSIKCK